MTADQEEVIITTVNVMRMPGVGSTVLVKVTWVMSPSAFYITFPRGVLDVKKVTVLWAEARTTASLNSGPL